MIKILSALLVIVLDFVLSAIAGRLMYQSMLSAGNRVDSANTYALGIFVILFILLFVILNAGVKRLVNWLEDEPKQ